MSPPPGAAWPAQIRQIGDPVLRTAVAPVADFGTALERLVDRMWAAMTDAHGVGLAANQIGVGLAVFVYQVDAFAGVLVNPGEPDLSGPLVLRDEGCLSVVGHSYPTERFEHAVVQGQDLTGRQVTVTGHGLTARVLQHEVDHLHGRLYLDRLTRPVRQSADRRR